jgi:hypothetical protein
MESINITRGAGRLRADILHDQSLATHKVWNPFTPLETPRWKGPYMCEVMGSTGMFSPDDEGVFGVTQGGKFLYDLKQYNFRNYYTQGATSATDLSTRGNYVAINFAEIGNTGEDGAEDRIRSGLTAGQLEFFELLPTPEGTIVETWISTLAAGVSGATGSKTLYGFSRAGELYGPC